MKHAGLTSSFEIFCIQNDRSFLLLHNKRPFLYILLPNTVIIILGTGKKKAVIVAYDLAYMQYSIKVGINVPQFVIHDKMENTHINQLKTIFQICNEIDGQYIIPILRERIDKIDQDYIDKAKILELSTDDKFFKI